MRAQAGGVASCSTDSALLQNEISKISFLVS
jgi:hypothetical protein